MGQLTQLVGMSGVLDIGIDMFTGPPGGDVCDFYLLDVNNKAPFEGKIEYRHYPAESREIISSGLSR